MKPILLAIAGCLLALLSASGCAGSSPALSSTGSTAPSPATARPGSATAPALSPTATPLPAAGQTSSPGAPVKGYRFSGTILSGGDTTPAGLQDAPRKFSYLVQTDDGRSITLTYTAYPPSPVADQKKITLNFHAGEILIGDYVRARGSYDEGAGVLVVAEAGDYIETLAHK